MLLVSSSFFFYLDRWSISCRQLSILWSYLDITLLLSSYLYLILPVVHRPFPSPPFLCHSRLITLPIHSVRDEEVTEGSEKPTRRDRSEEECMRKTRGSPVTSDYLSVPRPFLILPVPFLSPTSLSPYV